MDEAIIGLIRAGRTDDAFERLMPAYRRRVFGLAWSLLRDRAAAEDAAQEAFVKIWKALPRYDGRAALSTWIYAITRNTALSELRRRRRMLSLAEPAVAGEAERLHAVDPPAESQDAALWRAVEALPEKQRQAVTLYYQDDRPVEEVAAMMGIPVNTAKTHLHRARAALAERLADAREEDAA